MSGVDHSEMLEQFTRDAERLGLARELLFRSTLERYESQVRVLDRLADELENGEATVVRTYVKGAGSTYANPLIGEFNKAASAANQTCALLLKMKARAEDRAESIDIDDCEL